VDYSATAEKIQDHFRGCGAINRVTIPLNKYTSSPKGYAYVEFLELDSVEAALALDDTLFIDRQIHVVPKRTNVHGISTSNRPPRGGNYNSRGGRGFVRGRGAPYRAHAPPAFRGHYGGVRPRGAPRPRFGLRGAGQGNPYKLINKM